MNTSPTPDYVYPVSAPVILHDMLAGMQPAFRHVRTGEAHLAQSECGAPSPVYCFTGLPEEWVVERDKQGNPIALHPDVIAGYWRDARFIAITQLRTLPLDG